MKYVEIEEARFLPGLRLVLTTGVPGPWGEAAKGVLGVKGIEYTPVRQTPLESDAALVAWTGQSSAPVAVYEDEPPRSGWSEILFLAERLAPEPALIPSVPGERALMFGLAHEIAGELGLGWCRRLMIVDSILRPNEGRDAPEVSRHMGRKYGYDPDVARAAPKRVAEQLELLSAQLASQKALGRRYLVGEALSALDVYWACFCALFAPLPEEQCPLDPGMRAVYTNRDPTVAAALDPRLLDHRDFVYETHLGLPVDL